MHGLLVSCPFNFPNSNLKQQLSHIGVFICYQNIDAKNKLNLHIYGIHLLNPHKTVVSHLKFVVGKAVSTNWRFQIKVGLKTTMYLKVTIFFGGGGVSIPQCKTKRMDVKYKQENSLPSYKITRTRIRFIVFKIIEADRSEMMTWDKWGLNWVIMNSRSS